MKGKKVGLLERETQLLKLLCILSAIGFCFISAFFFLSPNVVNAQSTDQNQLNPISETAQLSIPDVEFENNKMYIGLWVIDVYNFDYRVQYYTIDMYVYFFWIDPNIATANWYLVNGYPVDPLDVKLVNSNTTHEVKYEIYRVPARLFTPPERASEYPFDQIELRIAIELLTSGYDVSLVWLENQTGLDPDFKNPGWNTVAVDLFDSEHAYPLDTKLPRAEMIITQERAVPIAVFVFSVSPPLLFGVLGGVTFLFIPRTVGLIGTRIGLIASILIADLLFNLSAGGIIPPLENIALYGALLFCVLIFLVMNLIVTFVGLGIMLRYNTDKYARRVNAWGFLISITIPITIFILILISA